MMNLFLVSTLVGAVLGMRMRVLILFPAIGVFFVAIAGLGFVRGEDLGPIAAAMVLAAISLQLGYLAGSTTRFAIAAARMPRRVDGAKARLDNGRGALLP
jgi:hypothetical protein